MNRKLLTLIIVILIIIFISLIGIIATTFIQPTIDYSKITRKNTQSEKIPPFAPDWVNWRIMDFYDPGSIKNSKIVDLINIENATKEANISFEGNEWIAIEKFKSEKDMEKSVDMTSYYMDKLNQNGWSFSQPLNETLFKGVAISNKNGNALSFIKIMSNEMQLFVLINEIIKPCPCSVVHRVFESKPINLDKIYKEPK